MICIARAGSSVAQPLATMKTRTVASPRPLLPRRIQAWRSSEICRWRFRLKASQSAGIVDPLAGPQAVHTDESRIRLMAEQFLAWQGDELVVAAE